MTEIPKEVIHAFGHIENPSPPNALSLKTERRLSHVKYPLPPSAHTLTHQLKIAHSQSGLSSWLGNISYNLSPHSQG